MAKYFSPQTQYLIFVWEQASPKCRASSASGLLTTDSSQLSPEKKLPQLYDRTEISHQEKARRTTWNHLIMLSYDQDKRKEILFLHCPIFIIFLLHKPLKNALTFKKSFQRDEIFPVIYHWKVSNTGRSWSADVDLECGFDFAPCTCVIRHVRGHPVCVKCATTSVVNTSISGSVVSLPSDKLLHYVLVTCG